MRHRWEKFAPHNRICIKCGTIKKTIELPPGNWQFEYYLPAGKKVILPKVPPCAPGEHTKARLDLWEQEKQKREAAGASDENQAGEVRRPEGDD